jgi:hypothetical protein
MDVNDEEEELVSELLHRASVAIICYENLLRSKEPQDRSKELAKAMRDLKDMLPDELLEICGA